MALSLHPHAPNSCPLALPWSRGASLEGGPGERAHANPGKGGFRAQGGPHSRLTLRVEVRVVPCKAQAQDKAPCPVLRATLPVHMCVRIRVCARGHWAKGSWSLVPSGSYQIMPIFEGRSLTDSISVSHVGSQCQAQSSPPQEIIEPSVPFPHSPPPCSAGAGPSVGWG